MVYFYRSSSSPPQVGGLSAPLPNFGVPFYLCVHNTLRRRTTKFDVVTHMGWGVLEVSHSPVPRSGALQRSPMFGVLFCL